MSIPNEENNKVMTQFIILLVLIIQSNPWVHIFFMLPETRAMWLQLRIKWTYVETSSFHIEHSLFNITLMKNILWVIYYVVAE